jgi:hypothetical protein
MEVVMSDAGSSSTPSGALPLLEFQPAEVLEPVVA